MMIDQAVVRAALLDSDEACSKARARFGARPFTLSAAGELEPCAVSSHHDSTFGPEQLPPYHAHYVPAWVMSVAGVPWPKEGGRSLWERGERAIVRIGRRLHPVHALEDVQEALAILWLGGYEAFVDHCFAVERSDVFRERVRWFSAICEEAALRRKLFVKEATAAIRRGEGAPWM